MEKSNFIIDEDFKGMRLDKALVILDKDISRMAVQRFLEQGKITVNGCIPKASYKVQVGDEIQLIKEPPKETNIKSQDIPIDILYEDDSIVVVNKPKGMVVHPANGNPEGTLVNAIMHACKGSLSGIGGEVRPRNCAQTR